MRRRGRRGIAGRRAFKRNVILVGTDSAKRRGLALQVAAVHATRLPPDTNRTCAILRTLRHAFLSRGHDRPLRKTRLCFDFFLCLSRACLGKVSVFSIKMAQETRFPHRDVTDIVTRGAVGVVKQPAARAFSARVGLRAARRIDGVVDIGRTSGAAADHHVTVRSEDFVSMRVHLDRVSVLKAAARVALPVIAFPIWERDVVLAGVHDASVLVKCLLEAREWKPAGPVPVRRHESQLIVLSGGS